MLNLFKLTPKKHTPPLPLYLDVDDVILNSSETIVSLLSPDRSIQDLKDWGYKSIAPITQSDLHRLFESPEFWTRVQIRPEFLSPSPLSHFNVHLTTHCSPFTRLLKSSFLAPLPFPYDFAWVPSHSPKSIIDMSNGIQVDDNINNLIPTNAAIKILLTNSLETTYNGQLFPSMYANIPNLYIVNTIQELFETLSFINENRKDFINGD